MQTIYPSPCGRRATPRNHIKTGRGIFRGTDLSQAGEGIDEGDINELLTATESADDRTLFILVKETEGENDPFLEYRYLDESEAKEAFFASTFPVVLVGRKESDAYEILAMTNLTETDKTIVEGQVELLNAEYEPAVENLLHGSRSSAFEDKQRKIKQYTFDIAVIGSYGFNDDYMSLKDVPVKIREALAKDIINKPATQVKIYDSASFEDSDSEDIT